MRDDLDRHRGDRDRVVGAVDLDRDVGGVRVGDIFLSANTKLRLGETEVVFEDGRKGRLQADLAIAEAERYPLTPLKKAG